MAVIKLRALGTLSGFCLYKRVLHLQVLINYALRHQSNGRKFVIHRISFIDKLSAIFQFRGYKPSLPETF